MASGNDRLRSAIDAAGLTRAQLAERAGVDRKSVERWITQGRTPHARTRLLIAESLGQGETYLWPDLLHRPATVPAELVQLWPTRDSMPGGVWRELIDSTTAALDVLVYSGGFIVEAHRLVDRIAELSTAGATIRIALGDPHSEEVHQRGIAEGLPSLPARAASTYEYLAPVRDLPGVDVRVHRTQLYTSVYRFDDALLVNLHTHGLPAKDNPVMHLQRVTGGQLYPYYLNAFERVWETARTPIG